jgi:hypothetical protein
MKTATLSVVATLLVAVPLLLAGHVWFMAQFSAAGIPLAVGAWIAARARSEKMQKPSAMLLLVASFPLAIWLGQLPGSVAWVRWAGQYNGEGVLLPDINAESFYVGIVVAGVLTAAIVAIALRLQTGSLRWSSFAFAALAVCTALAVVYGAFRPGTVDGDVVQSLALAVWLGVLSLQWGLGLRRALAA